MNTLFLKSSVFLQLCPSLLHHVLLLKWFRILKEINFDSVPLILTFHCRYHAWNHTNTDTATRLMIHTETGADTSQNSIMIPIQIQVSVSVIRIRPMQIPIPGILTYNIPGIGTIQIPILIIYATSEPSSVGRACKAIIYI